MEVLAVFKANKDRLSPTLASSQYFALTEFSDHIVLSSDKIFYFVSNGLNNFYMISQPKTSQFYKTKASMEQQQRQRFQNIIAMSSLLVIGLKSSIFQI